MSTLLRTAAAISGCLALSQLPPVARSEYTQRSQTSWLGWLVKDTPTIVNESPNLESLNLLAEQPGHVLVWGGKFGRSPVPVPGLGESILKVAVVDALGVAINTQGHVYAFHPTENGQHIQPIYTSNRAVDVAIRQAEREVVILDAAGKVSVVKCTEKEFQPARMLQGAIKRRRITKVRCGTQHCIAVTDRGEAFSWGGTNSHGQLGTGVIGKKEHENDIEEVGKVELPSGVRVVDASCGNRHSLFLDTQGDLYAVGDDHWAQLGISAEPWLRSHVHASGEVRKSQLVGGLAAHAVASGGQHSVILVRDGTVFTFGFNQWGQLGHHNYSTLAPPSPIADYRIRAVGIAAGDNHTCLVRENGELWCIGGNESGQLGVGNLQPSMTWKKVRVGKNVVKPSFLYSGGCVNAVVVPTLEEKAGGVSGK